MAIAAPSVIVLAGPNGAGKTSAAPALLKNVLGIVEFVNADTIAQGLAAFSPDRVALEAGAILLTRLHELAAQRRSFAFETTLASRSFAPWLAGLVRSGYEFHLVFLWLSSRDLAVDRVADRVRLGGHGVPEPTVRRRYAAGMRNFFTLYRPLATTWRLYDNSDTMGVRLIADGEGTMLTRVNDGITWRRIEAEHSHGERS